MDCQEVRAILSTYHDGELPVEPQTAVSRHLANCPDCQAELDSFRAISQLAARLDKPRAADRWAEIKNRLDSDKSSEGKRTVKNWFARRRLLAAAAAFLMAGIGIWSFWPHSDHHLATDFDSFLKEFQESPDEAERMLVARYSGRRVTIKEAADELRYRPVAAEASLSNCTLTDLYLLKMPCCTCLEAVYRNPSGGVLCVFEHDGDQAVWFGRRPAIETLCHGRACRLVQAEGFLAASWKAGPRYLTVVGAANIEEVAGIVKDLGGT